MKNKIKKIVLDAAIEAHKSGSLPAGNFPDGDIEEPKIEAHGDLSSNLAMKSASIQKMAPNKIARAIMDKIQDPENIFKKIEIAGPGFINFHLRKSALHTTLKTIHEKGKDYGRSNLGMGQRVQVEFVSANPTGPLHVGHGRGAAVGDAVGNILSFCGYQVQREYYVNDSGRQIRTLGLSVYLRYRELSGQDIDFPDNCYQGDYIKDLAGSLMEMRPQALAAGNEEDAVLFCAEFAASKILKGIQDDLDVFGVKYDKWYSEKTLFDSGKVDKAISVLTDQGIIYEKDGAKWFRTTDYGDEKDRVVVRDNGITTYFASDIAYHKDKFQRGFAKVIDVWGADHHGYIERIKASIEASGYDRENFNVILVQLVNLRRGGQPVAMSTRSGEFVTLADVVDEVGKDAARFIFLTRHYESPLDFDLDLAKKNTNENPVFYVQYVHARISSIERKAKEDRGITEVTWNGEAIGMLREPEEIKIIKQLGKYKEVVEQSGNSMEPHRITFYLMELASLFHSYYNKHKVLTDDDSLTRGRLYMVSAIRQVIKNGLLLLGVSAPEKM